MDDPFGIAFDELPAEIAVFPLPGVLLLPGGRLPLNIFEPRYLNMILDCLGEGRMIGMIQPTEDARDPRPEDIPLEQIGCAGRVVSFAETGDGRLMVSLDGICRFDVSRELENRNGYRRVAADYSRFAKDMDQDDVTLDRDKLFAVLRHYFETKGLQADLQSMERADDTLLIASLGMLCPFSRQEKQALLGAESFSQMAEIIISLMEMAARSDDRSQAKH